MSTAETIAAIESADASGDAEWARSLAADAVARGLSHPLALRLAADGLRREGREDEAIGLLRRALGLQPNDIDTLIALAGCLMDLDRRREALPVFKAALDADPSRADAHYGAGECLATMGAVDDAQARFEAALALGPLHADAGASLANLHARTGNWREGRARAEAVLVFAPGHATAMAAMAACEVGEGAFDEAKTRLTFMLEPRGAEPPLTPLLHAAMESLLGEALHGLGRYPQAFDAWRRGNEERRLIHAGWAMSSEELRYLIGTLTEAFSGVTPQDWRVNPDTGASGARGHVFLLGYPRSGTTLLEHILGAHPKVTALEEGDLLAEAARRFFGRADGPRSLLSLDDATAKRFRDAYWRRAREAGAEVEGRVFVDKMPLDTINLPIIAALFPNAKVLFARRDPRDTVLSGFRQVFAPNPATYAMLALDGAADLYDAVMRLAEVYRTALPLDLREVRHERLVEDFESETRGLCDYLGLEWSDAFHDFAANAQARTISTPSAGQVRRGIYRETVPTWMRYADQLAPVLPKLQPWVDRFGYA
ncbi:MAG TPA: sulfotransferase [Caulobacteraceae bacterium]|jgi:tetratricopeptide (TPR) repeat protein|nr:sulfotransferase [Caulobacteraceae bacterium]